MYKFGKYGGEIEMGNETSPMKTVRLLPEQGGGQAWACPLNRVRDHLISWLEKPNSRVAVNQCREYTYDVHIPRGPQGYQMYAFAGNIRHISRFHASKGPISRQRKNTRKMKTPSQQKLCTNIMQPLLNYPSNCSSNARELWDSYMCDISCKVFILFWPRL